MQNAVCICVVCVCVCVLRIDKGSQGGALYLGLCIHNYGNCNVILHIE